MLKSYPQSCNPKADESDCELYKCISCCLTGRQFQSNNIVGVKMDEWLEKPNHLISPNTICDTLLMYDAFVSFWKSRCAFIC